MFPLAGAGVCAALGAGGFGRGQRDGMQAVEVLTSRPAGSPPSLIFSQCQVDRQRRPHPGSSSARGGHTMAAWEVMQRRGSAATLAAPAPACLPLCTLSLRLPTR